MGQIGLSGLSGSPVKPHFRASLIFFTKRQPLIFCCFEFLFKPLHPLYPLHPIIISCSYFALVVQTLLMQDWSTEKIYRDRIGRA